MADVRHSGTPEREGGNLLPDGWQLLVAADCFDQVSTNGIKVKTKDCKEDGAYPVIDQGKEYVSGYINDPSKLILVSKPLLIFGDHTRNIKWIDFDFVPGADGTKVLAPKEFILPRLAYYSLCALEIPDKGYSRHFKFLKELSIPLPPLAEQKVIAEKLDTLLAQVDTTKARLERIPDIIKRFRQSVLAAAVSGKLGSNDGDMFLFELDSEKWDIPKSWKRVAINELTDKSRPICYGVVQPGNEVEKGKLLIRVCDINDGEVDFSNLRTISQEIDEQYKRSRVTAGDILITIVGAIGRIGIVRENTEANIARAVARISPQLELVTPMYLHIWLSSPNLQWWLVNSSKEVARKTLNLKELKEAPIALPSLEEQTEIVRRVEELFAFADTIEQKAAAALERVNNLTQSILAKAFRGELTANWRDANPELISGDNSAEALLAKIHAEREALVIEKKAAKKPRKKKETI